MPQGDTGCSVTSCLVTLVVVTAMTIYAGTWGEVLLAPGVMILGLGFFFMILVCEFFLSLGK